MDEVGEPGRAGAGLVVVEAEAGWSGTVRRCAVCLYCVLRGICAGGGRYDNEGWDTTR